MDQELLNNVTNLTLNTINKQDTGKKRQGIKEQFYTNESIAKKCIANILSLLPETKDYLWIEPSAGDGVFIKNIPHSIDRFGIDIEPRSKNILCKDFLSSWEPDNANSKPIVMFGNPPFGKQSKLAKLFIKKSCKLANIIAFILPKSFVKPSMNNAFDLKFNCIFTKELPKDSFVINGEAYDVPCVFQIWKKEKHNRIVVIPETPKGFSYVKSDEEHDIIFRRVGGNAGKCHINDGTKYSKQSHHFIKLNSAHVEKSDDIIKKINQHVFPSNTVGPRSLSKGEINAVMNKVINEVI